MDMSDQIQRHRHRTKGADGFPCSLRAAPRAIAGIVLLGLLAPASAAAAPEHPVVAVHPIEVSGLRLKPRVIKGLSTLLAAELAASKKYQVMPRAEIKALLRKGKLDSRKECVDRSCWIDLYREMAANKMLVTDVMEIGRKCTVTSVLYDLLRGASEPHDRSQVVHRV